MIKREKIDRDSLSISKVKKFIDESKPFTKGFRGYVVESWSSNISSKEWHSGEKLEWFEVKPPEEFLDMYREKSREVEDKSEEPSKDSSKSESGSTFSNL